MSVFMVRVAIVLLAVTLSGSVWGHGSATQWSAEGTEYGCWISRWLMDAAAPGGGEAASVQVVLGRIAPPRTGPAQPGLSKSELEGAMTLNVRLVDPSLTGAQGVNALRDGGVELALEKRQLEGELGDFPSFYLTGSGAESVLASLRGGQLAAITVRRADGSEARFASGDEGLQVALAMYDACLKAKQGPL